MDANKRTSRRSLLRAAGLGVGAAGAAIAAGSVAALAGTDETNQVDEGAVNISEATTVLKSSSTAGAAFVGQSTTGRPGLFGHTAATDTGNPSTGGHFAGVVGLGVGGSATGVMAREGSGASAALAVVGRARFSRSGRANVKVGKASRRVSLAGVTASSLVLAVLAKDVPGRSVRAVVPTDESFTVHLNGTVTAETPVTYIVFDPSLE